MSLVPLWTDILLWLLVLGAVVYALYVRRHEHLCAPWRRVVHSGAAMACLCILAVYLAIGLADSIHYKALLQPAAGGKAAVYSAEVRSVLDTLLTRLREANEKTYSAPLAIRAFSKESIDQPGGGILREYPRLRYGGAQLRDDAQWVNDVLARALQGLALGVAGWGLCAAALTWWLARRAGSTFGRRWAEIWRGETAIRWRAAYLTALLLGVAGAVVFVLALGYHVLGTDKVGRDVLYQSLKSVRTALVIGTLTTVLTLPFALALGIAAGYFKGWVDDAVQYLYTTLNSIPSVLLIAAFVLIMQVYIDKHPEKFTTTLERADLRLLFLCMILGVTSWTGLARLLRGETLKLRELEYIQAAQAFGVSSLRIMSAHIARNIMHLAVITLVTDFSGLVLAEAVLSYIGIGVDPTMNSFGSMINAARLELSRDPMVWWSLAAAFTFMLILVLAANLLADAVRDAFDPRIVLSRPVRPRAKPKMALAGRSLAKVPAS